MAAIYRHNHELAWWAGQYLADRWGTRFATPEEMIGSMVNVRLPVDFGSTEDDAERLRAALEAEAIEVPIYAAPGELTTPDLRADLLRPRRHRASRRRGRQACCSTRRSSCVDQLELLWVGECWSAAWCGDECSVGFSEP